MSANSALITDSAKSAARHTLSDYSAGVFAHTTGDWGQHNVVRVYDQQFLDQAGTAHVVTVKTLRVLATHGSGDLALAIPINPTGQDVLLTSPPLITVQPHSLLTGLNLPARFVVGAISDTPLSYQWFKAGVAVVGQTASQLFFQAVTLTDASSYFIEVSNLYGTTTSTTATLTITQGASAPDDGGFDILSLILPPHIPFL